jgi:ribonuclease P/MRP protein subunit RPP40
LCTALDNNIVSDVILIDFSKAFDVVPHSKLINKLASLGVCDPTLRWITAFLCGRAQSVVLNGVCSCPSAVTSGVIQGSVLGPTLFALYVSDLPAACPNCSIGQYADDTKASRQITTPRDRVILQSSLDSLCDWAARHELALSLDKCSYLQVGYTDSAITYTVGSRVLKPSHVVTDLGIVVQSNLKPGLHCTQVASRANARARLILESFLSRDTSCLTRAFTTYVRPQLEYATPVWSPHLKQDIDLIEGVQRTFTRKLFYICGLPPTTYNERLRLLGLQRLELRRLHCDLLFMFKLTHGITDCQLLKRAITHAPRSGLRGHRYKLLVPSAKKLVLSSHFIIRTIPVWNSLPDYCFVPDSYYAFKVKIAKVDLCKYMIGKE